MNWDLFKLLVSKYALYIDGHLSHSVKFDESDCDAYESEVEVFHDYYFGSADDGGLSSKYTTFSKSQIEDAKIWDDGTGIAVSYYNLTFRTRPSIVNINEEWKFL